MKNKKIKLAIGWFFLNLGCFFGQDSREISLSQAIDFALKNKSEAIKAGLEIKKSEEKIREVRSNALPRVNIVSNTTYSPILQEMVIPSFMDPTQTMKLTMGQKWQSNNSVQVQQVLFNQSVFTGLKAAKSTREFYIINAQLTEEQLIEKVATAYYQVYQAEQMLSNLDENIKITEQTKTIIKGLYDAGLAKKIDFDRIQVALNNVNSSRQNILNAVELSKNALKFMMGMEMNQNITLSSADFSPSEWINQEMDITQRTELKVLNKQLELLEWQKKVSEASFYPTMALVGNYGWLGQGKNMPWWNGQKNGVYWSDLASITLSVNIPIFNGFSIKSKVEQNKIDIEQAQVQLRDTQLALDMSYRNAKAKMQNTLTSIEIQKANVSLAEEVRKNTQNNYKFGLATLNDILETEKSLVEAKNNLTQSELEYKLSEIELLKSQGKLRKLVGN